MRTVIGLVVLFAVAWVLSGVVDPFYCAFGQLSCFFQWMKYLGPPILLIASMWNSDLLKPSSDPKSRMLQSVVTNLNV